MVRLKIAYWEFDFEAVCPTLDHDLLSQAHISLTLANTHWLSCQPVTWATQSSPNQSKTEVNTHTEVTPCVSEKGVGGRKSVLWTPRRQTAVEWQICYRSRQTPTGLKLYADTLLWSDLLPAPKYSRETNSDSCMRACSQAPLHFTDCQWQCHVAPGCLQPSNHSMLFRNNRKNQTGGIYPFSAPKQ